ncbi:MAG: phospholipid scramblase-related protein [Bacteroidota bacterium]
MHPILNQNLYFVKEHLGLFKAANNFDIFEPKSQQQILKCREEVTGMAKFLRWTDFKRITPFHIEIQTPKGEKVLSVRRGWTFWRSRVEVFDHRDQLVGTFRQRLLSLGGKFEVLSPTGELLCMLKGKWTGWNFQFIRDTQVFAEVTKKWNGIGREMFTTADNYMLSIGPSVPSGHPLRILILAAVMSIDMVLKE